MLEFVVANGRKGIVQGLDAGTAPVRGFEFRRTGARVHGVKEVAFLRRIVLHGNLWGGLRFQIVGVGREELVVRFVRFLFDALVEIVGGRGVGEVERHDDPIVKKGHVLGNETIPPPVAAPELFADQQVVQLVPGFGKVHPEQLGSAPLPQRFHEVQDGQVGKVGHAGNRFERGEARVRPIDRLASVKVVKQEGLEGAHQDLVALRHGSVINGLRVVSQDGGDLRRQRRCRGVAGCRVLSLDGAEVRRRGYRGGG